MTMYKSTTTDTLNNKDIVTGWIKTAGSDYSRMICKILLIRRLPNVNKSINRDVTQIDRMISMSIFNIKNSQIFPYIKELKH